MLATKLCTRILGNTKRHVITNLPLCLAELRDYMKERWPTVSIENRITIITDARVLKRFWLTQGNGWWIPDVSKPDWNLGLRLDFRKAYRWREMATTGYHRDPIPDMTVQELRAAINADPSQMEMIEFSELAPCQFIIDELQCIFPSRSFMQTSPGCLYWLAQQRHLGADFIGITQNIDLIDKEFRDLADDFLYITNWGRKQKSRFRLPKLMTWQKYDVKPGPGVTPMLTGMFKIDVEGIGKCYDTSAGVGIEGSLDADTKEKPPGIHWSWFFVIAIVGLYLLSYVPGFVSRIMMRALGWTQKQTSTAVATVNGTNTLILSNNATPQAIRSHTPTPVVDTFYEDHTNLTGITFIDSKPMFYFGSKVLNHKSRGFQEILHEGSKATGVRFNGTNYYLNE